MMDIFHQHQLTHTVSGQKTYL